MLQHYRSLHNSSFRGISGTQRFLLGNLLQDHVRRHALRRSHPPVVLRHLFSSRIERVLPRRRLVRETRLSVSVAGNTHQMDATERGSGKRGRSRRRGRMSSLLKSCVLKETALLSEFYLFFYIQIVYREALYWNGVLLTC